MSTVIPSLHAEVHASVDRMVALQIRDVPESVRDDLARAAKARGQSLQSFLREVIDREARAARNREFLRTYVPPQRNKDVPPLDVVEYLEREREERTRRILGWDEREPDTGARG